MYVCISNKVVYNIPSIIHDTELLNYPNFFTTRLDIRKMVIVLCSRSSDEGGEGDTEGEEHHMRRVFLSITEQARTKIPTAWAHSYATCTNP